MVVGLDDLRLVASMNCGAGEQGDPDFALVAQEKEPPP